MSESIDFNYDFNYGPVIKGLENVEQRLGRHETMLDAIKTNNPFKEATDQLDIFNRKLADGTRIYQSIQGGLKGYRAELKRLQDLEKEVIKTQLEFKNSLEYDEATRNLIAVRRRIQEINEALEKAGGQAEKTGGKITSFGGLVKKGLGLLATYFTVDALVDTEKKIIEITGTYEKYNAVLTNAFKNEKLAASGMQLISDLAVKTPFQINELTESYVKYVNRAIIPTREELIKQGDIAAASGKSFDQLTEAILDSITGENERLKEFGIKATTTGDQVVYSFRGIEKQVKKTDQEGIRKAILSFGELQGVTGSMTAIMGTLNGAISNMQDNWEQFLKNLGEKQGGPLHTVINLLGRFTNFLREVTTTSPVEALVKERNEFNALANTILLANEKSALRNSLVAELLQKYPSLLSFLDAEKVSNDGLARIMQYVNSQYEYKIKLAAQDVLVKRNVEQVADAMGRQRTALQALNDAYSNYLQNRNFSQDQITKKLADFTLLSDKERKKVIEGIKEEQKARAAFPVTSGGQVTDLALKAQKNILALEDLERAQKDYDKAVADGNVIGKENQQIETNRLKDKEKLITKYKDEISGLEKKNKLSTEENVRLKELRAELKGIENDGKTPEFPKSKPIPTASDLSKAAQAQAEQRKLLAELEKEYAATQQRLLQLQLDGDNVRLSLLKKSSKEYIDAKRNYDYQLLYQEKQTQIKLFAEENAKRVKTTDATGKVNTEKQDLITYETNRLVGTGIPRDQARNQARDIVTSQFEKSQQPNAVAARQLLEAKQTLIELNASEDDIARLRAEQDQLVAVMGDGFEKEKALITAKYQQLYKLYEGNSDIINVLRITKQKEIAEKLLASDQQQIQNQANTARELAQLEVKQNSENQASFEERKNKNLLQIELDYYKKSLEKLKAYLLSAAYIRALANGQISDEQATAYADQVALLEAQLKKSQSNLDNFTASTLVKFNRFNDAFDIGKALFKDSPFFNGQYAEVYRESTTRLIDETKQMLTAIYDTQIQQSQERIKLYDQEVTAQEAQLQKEEDFRNQGLANSYEATKKQLEDTKRAREEEKEHLKKVQKEKAVIEAAEAASSTAVAAANLIAAAADAIKNWASVPFVGVFLGLAAAATLVGGFVSIKSRIKQAQTLRKGSRLNGPSHEMGGMDIIDPSTGEAKYNVEGNEWLIGSEPSEKHNSLLKHINEDTFKQLDKDKQLALLKPLGFSSDLTADVYKTGRLARNVSNLSALDRRELIEMNRHLLGIVKNTGKKQRYALGNNVLVVMDDDKVLGYENFNPPK